MSEYATNRLAFEYSILGHGRTAWHTPKGQEAALKAAGMAFDGAIPWDVVAAHVAWQPASFKIETVVDPATMLAYDVPDNLANVAAKPGRNGANGRVRNFAGGGYANAIGLASLMLDNLKAAMDAECEATTAVDCNDGDYLCVTLIPNDGVVLGAQFGGVQPYASLISSLTSKIRTLVGTGSTVVVCDNTAHMASETAAQLVSQKRTTNAMTAEKIKPSAIREALDISFAETELFVAQKDREAQIGLSDAQIRSVLDAWRPLVMPDGTAKEGRALTIATNERGTITGMLEHDDRVKAFGGKTVAGLWQAHNTFQHWNMTARGNTDRIARQSIRQATGEVDALDAEFMALVSQFVPEYARVLAPAV